LLDISIRDATNNRHSLDEVTRNLYTRFYKQGKGFRTADLLALFSEAGMPDINGFYQRYINGRDSLPYEQILPKAGIAVQRTSQTSLVLGVSFGGATNVLGGVMDGGPAQQAGLQAGDTIVSVGDITVKPDEDWGPTFRSRYAGKTGPVPVVLRRDGKEMTVNVTPTQRTLTRLELSRMTNPTPKAAKVWQGIATGTVDK